MPVHPTHDQTGRESNPAGTQAHAIAVWSGEEPYFILSMFHYPSDLSGHPRLDWSDLSDDQRAAIENLLSRWREFSYNEDGAGIVQPNRAFSPGKSD